VSKLSSRLKEREEQLSEAQDCYSKLDAIYQAEKADIATALSSKVGTICPCTHAWHIRSTDIPHVCTAALSSKMPYQCPCTQALLCAYSKFSTLRMHKRLKDQQPASRCMHSCNSCASLGIAMNLCLNVRSDVQENELKAVHAREQAQHEQQIKQLTTKVEEAEALREQQVRKLEAEVRKQQSRSLQDTQKLQAEVSSPSFWRAWG